MASLGNVPDHLSLTENDISGASLLGRKPEQLKNEELKFWLKCRGDPAKGLKTKAELVKRVNGCIASGRDKAVVFSWYFLFNLVICQQKQNLGKSSIPKYIPFSYFLGN